jgi:hypothetical protein
MTWEQVAVAVTVLPGVLWALWKIRSARLRVEHLNEQQRYRASRDAYERIWEKNR